MRLSRAPQKPLCQMTAGVRSAHPPSGGIKEVGTKKTSPVRMLCSSNGSCDVWQLGQHAPLRLGALGGGGGGAGHAIASRSKWQTQQRGEGHPVDLVDSPRHLAQIKLGAGGGSARVACSAISPDGTFVACCSGSGPIRLYRLVDEEPQAAVRGTGVASHRHGGAPVTVQRIKMPAGTDRAVALALSSAGHLAAAHPDGSISCFELPPAKEPVATPEEEDASKVLMASSAKLVSRSSASEVLGPPEDRHRLSWRLYHSPISSIVASPDGSTLAASGASGLILIRLPDLAASPAAAPPPPLQRLGKVLRSQHDAPASGVSFSADGKLLAAALASGNLLVYDVEGARPTQVGA